MRLISDDVVSIGSVRIRRRRIAHQVGRTLPVVPVPPEAAVSIGSDATGDSGNFGWLTVPARVLLSRLYRARSVARDRWPCLPEMPADPAA